LMYIRLLLVYQHKVKTFFHTITEEEVPKDEHDMYLYKSVIIPGFILILVHQ
jgi:hypothetical protein